VSEIAIYVEGGGNTAEQKAELRRGFDALFASQKSRAREKRIGLKFVCCGGRQEAYESFVNELKVNPEVLSALLVDSETALVAVPMNTAGDPDEVADAEIRIAHLRRKTATGGRGQGDGWPLAGVPSERVHLMVQCMEAWIVADPDKLEEFYKQGFKKDSLPVRPNLEDEPKNDIYDKLERATKSTQKGKYGKIIHASKLLPLIRPEKVAEHCPRFAIFRNWLTETIDA
jgi:hypothetical protein